MIRYEKDINNIVTLTLDQDDSISNTITHDIGKSFLPVLAHLQTEKNKGLLRGVVIASAKKNFLAGADVDFYYQCQDANVLFETSQQLSHFLRSLELPGVPVVAALSGTALGAGFELALACHHRIAIHSEKIKLGLPEVSYGAIPAGGAIVRLMWLLGIERAYHIVTDGHRYTPKEALAVGIIDELADDERDLIERAKAWLLGHHNARRPWDTEGEQIPSGALFEPEVQATIQRLIAEQYKKNYLNFPANQAVLSILVEGARVDFDTACRIQSRYFTKVLLTKEAKSMMKAFWYDFQNIRLGQARPKGFGKFRPQKVGVIGAGLMGSGIAYSCARAGLEVVLKDISRSVAEKGKMYAQERLQKLVQHNEITQAEADNTLLRINPTEQVQMFRNCDIIIEAVFENQGLKSKILKEAEAFIDQYSIIASNTSSIPITKLAKTTLNPDNFCGMRFFRPVDETPLVEIIKGERTTDETIARAFDFIRLIGKVPIVVKDSWGFYAGRVRNTYILEGIAMLLEGFAPALIENLGIQLGMPMGSLALADDLSLDLVLEYETQAAELYGARYVRHPAANILEKMLSLNRTGKTQRAGFYDYMLEKNGEPEKYLWSGLDSLAPPSPPEEGELQSVKNELKKINPTNNDGQNSPPLGGLGGAFSRDELSERLIFVQVLEAVWCMQEKIVGSAAEANLGSIYGWGFPLSKGGVLQYVNDYGLAHFVHRSTELEKIHGRRFKVPSLLREMAAKGERF